MFANLRQGNTVYVLEQSDKLTLKAGQIIENKPNYTGSMDMKVKIDDNEYELKQLSYNKSIARNGSIVVSENLNDLLNEVRNLKADSEDKIKNYDYYEQNVKDCDAILRQYDSSYEKEQKVNEEITELRQQNDELKQQIQSMSQSLSNIEKLLSNNNSKN